MALNESGTQKVSSVGLIQNGRNGALTFVKSHDFQGRIGAIPYPQEIPDGQWAEFVHSGYVGTTPESIGAVVYRCKNPDGQQCDWMICWLNKHGDNSRRKVHTEIKETGHYDRDNIWKDVKIALTTRGARHSEAQSGNWSATVDIYAAPINDCDAFAIFQGIIQAN
ncbi:23 kDa jasmonate-induced protein-like [Diospyros lotus]|uniref:23 kDa jasmonate-induced protein-like n=1 Tax=Diospyros lotus TaxID=55363 RepID=UPI00224F3628|nr:23 kDa jasmonate-induced protein-like [Diospyros lotus]XP_052183001.1 23 kDa jasmonate-induced protein-like [Diospyros lotus]